MYSPHREALSTMTTEFLQYIVAKKSFRRVAGEFDRESSVKASTRRYAVKVFVDQRELQLPIEKCSMPTLERPGRRKLCAVDAEFCRQAHEACM